MKDLYDVMQLLKRYGTIIYTADFISDIDLMESDIRDLYDHDFITPREYASALMILRQKRTEYEKKGKS
ncbi:YqgQ family protein [Planococcus sp. CP5-4]|uniref:YqgQ family protein n=1 Tax=Planococcus TaxID=1372 RepID=UPI001B8BE966|nr:MULTISPECIES: YqgQ family protein [unclassified Planococcus (in: firmicutes)]MBU9672780.1 YqgQ family protein [Planococcus sp. CP5-4_YE]MBV0908552.1 YqgQ family protein [Planococcus sp. CP5-4_UN]MBW6063321.1 YqgQ family protein [Planococcus sp. CP5-4]MDN5709739.1 YqgQ family protein [Planococcus sp. (in: firmicutes)]